MVDCPNCKGALKKLKVDYNNKNYNLGKFLAMVCSHCKEEWFVEATSEKIQKIQKKKGLFGLSRKSKISYSGNSLIVRIPEPIARYMNIQKKDEIIVHPEGKNKITVKLV